MGAIFVQTLSIGGTGPKVAVKDTIDIAGFPTRAGSRVFADAPSAERHADVVQALLDGGCHIIGKTNLHELAFGVTGLNGWTGTPVNPLYPDLVPGGSSSGSAVAVAAGLVDFALGTDTGGSVRVPAACCGVYGLKPSFGRVSRRGVAPAKTSLDCVGPLARDLDTIERAMAVIDPSYRRESMDQTPILGPVDLEADPDVSSTVASAIQLADVSTIQVALPNLERAFEAGLAIIGAETWVAFGDHALSPDLGEDVRRRLLAARDVTHEQLLDAERVRAVFVQEVDRLLDHVDALALPTIPGFPLSLACAAGVQSAVGVTTLVRPFNLSGHPALSIPLKAPSGLPVGLQLIGRRGADARLCAIARHFIHST